MRFPDCALNIFTIKAPNTTEPKRIMYVDGFIFELQLLSDSNVKH